MINPNYVDGLELKIKELAAERDAALAQNAELVAQVVQLHGTLGKALDLAETGAANNWYLEGADDIWIIDALKEHAKGIPEAQQCLRQIQADAGRAGFVAGLEYPDKVYFQDATSDLAVAADQYADKIRQGGEA